jgi:diketogulonate reductase-like aldo/keto reductase
MKRRTLLLGLVPSLGCAQALAQPAASLPPLTRRIPSSGEEIPAIGLGTWITFNVGNDREARAGCAEVMRNFFAMGGRVIDSSPMYGSSQGVVGDGLQKLGLPRQLFSADKVWTSSGGAAQVEASRKLWRVPRFDLLQVHNLLAWQEHLPLLQAMKAQGRLRYVGITTSEGRRHGDMEQIMRNHRIDFAQFTYNPLDREVEQRLLPLARERGIAVLVNRPFREGELLRHLRRHPLPAWAAEIDSQVAHVRENMAAAGGRMPDDALRRRIAAHIGGL